MKSQAGQPIVVAVIPRKAGMAGPKGWMWGVEGGNGGRRLQCDMWQDYAGSKEPVNVLYNFGVHYKQLCPLLDSPSPTSSTAWMLKCNPSICSRQSTNHICQCCKLKVCRLSFRFQVGVSPDLQVTAGRQMDRVPKACW